MKHFFIRYHKLFAGLGVLIGVVLFLGAYFFWKPDISRILEYLKSEDLDSSAVIVSFAVLPLLGFPVTPLLLLLGVRFGHLGGIGIMFLVMPIHLVISLALTRSFLRPFIKKFAFNKASPKLKVPADRHMEFAFLFMAVPGLPYAMKNYLLPLSNVPFRYYFIFGWLVQGSMGTLLVVFGNASVNWNLPFLIGLAVLFVLISLFSRWAKKRYQRMTAGSEK